MLQNRAVHSYFRLMKKLFVSIVFGVAAAAGMAQTLCLKDFEKLNIVKSPKDYLANKDFIVKQDSSSGENIIKLKLVNKATHELVQLSVVTGSEGDRTLEVQYFTLSREEYGKIVRTILKSGYDGKGDNRHFEKRNGSYETENVFLREMVLLKDAEYYAITYTHYTGKELALPRKN
jgi:hypothetical protein